MCENADWLKQGRVEGWLRGGRNYQLIVVVLCGGCFAEPHFVMTAESGDIRAHSGPSYYTAYLPPPSPHSASRGGHFRQILILLEKFFNHLDDWFRSLFMCLKLSNTFKHIFPKDIAYSILELSKMTEKAEKNQNFQVFMFTYFLVTKMIMMFSICSKLKKNSF